MRNEPSVHKHVERIPGRAVQLDDRAYIQLQETAYVHGGPSHFHGQLHTDVEDHITGIRHCGIS
jgi:hypothetical protein